MVKHPKICLTAGFALFSMFFGSGNLVFPLHLGREVGSSYPYATLGLIFTAVLVPILGFLGIILSDGNRQKYFNLLGPLGTFLITALMLSLIGPFGVVPRCIGVAFGGFHIMFPTLDISVFSLFFCSLTGALVWKANKVVSIIGMVLTPFKLGGIILLILMGLYFSKPIEQLTGHSAVEAFNLGINQGYQTMDLLAAFFFACSIVDFLKNHFKKKSITISQKDIFMSGVCSGLLGAALLSIVYYGFIALGAHYAPFIKNIPSESLLVYISGLAIGPKAIPLVSFTMAVSCLATATILVKLFADFLKEDVLFNKISYHMSIFITLVISYIASLFGFTQIVAWLGWFLSWMYPVLIAYAVYKILIGVKSLKSNHFEIK